ncbi:PKD domain-containing protein [Nakamurella deserti]|uniref:PKD domain-containing protein n=1 Tax=Nakamurella deserti TaxID=2164074 RepID=UPI00197C3683|nr:PKD domain-containing protein [Nakamurella deserti]
MFNISRQRWRVLLTVAVLAGAGVVHGGSGVAAAAPGPVLTPPTQLASADALPTAQVDGVVWQQAIVGNTVYAGGNFATARPAGVPVNGAGQVTRTHLLSYDIRTGVLNAGFAPVINGQVRAVTASPDGSRIYVGGDFRTVNGSTKTRIAAFSTATGQLITAFDPNVDYVVRAIVATDSTVFVGGSFSNSRGVPRGRLAAFSASTGALLGWNPNADGTVNSMVMAPDGSKLVVGGSFQNVGGGAAYGMAAISPTTGARLPWNATNAIRNAGTNSAILSLTTDGTSIYGSGYRFGTGGNLEGAFRLDPGTGDVQWIEDCHGDTYDTAVANGIVYTVSHAHFCGNIGGFWQSEPWYTNMRHALAFTRDATGTVDHDRLGYFDWFGFPSPSLYNWFPDVAVGDVTGQAQAAWDITANSEYVVLGGEFPTVNGVAQAGLVRFRVKSAAPNDQGPRVSGAGTAPRLTALSPTSVRVSWQTNWDRDDLGLTYRVIRDGNTAAPVCTVTRNSTFWERPSLSCVDTGLSPGTHTYRVEASDPYQNTVGGATTSITPSSAPARPYVNRVLADGAAQFWRLGESGGAVAADTAGFTDAAVTSVTRGAAGAVRNDPDTATTFAGTSASTMSTTVPVQGPDTFTVEGWFRTTTTAGGKIIGFGNRASGASTSYDRQIYLDNTGRVYFGVNGGSARTVNSTGTYRDGAWHHVAATLGTGGMALYVDGTRVASRTDVTSGQYFSGYWRVGGDNLNGWAARPTSDYFAGSLDDVAVYPVALSAATIAEHRAVGTAAAGNQTPTASFTAQTSGLGVSVDGSGSIDPDGTVTAYSWNWGDGTAASSGVTATHTYATAGTRTVTLTVTDQAGASSSTSRTVTVTAPATQPPTASFTATVTGLAVSVDGRASSDPDGTVAAHSWNWGDGSPADSGATAGHTYATAGQYTVQLTVTDDRGATATTSRAVTVTAAPTAGVTDTFERTVTGGWGSTDSGQAWSAAGGTTRFSVSGGAGQLSLNAPGAGPTASLDTVSQRDIDGTVDITLSGLPTTGNGVYATMTTRRAASSGYVTSAKFLPGGAVTVSLSRLVNGASTSLGTATVPGLVYAPGDVVRVRFQAVGGGSTALAVKAWKVGTAEPAGFALTRTDTTAALQSGGGFSLQAYLSSGSDGAPITARVDNLRLG